MNHSRLGVRALPFEIGGVAVVSTAAFLLFFPHRSDYAGHLLGGLGATLLLLGVIAAATNRKLNRTVVPLTLVAIALGAVAESTVFRIAIFDPVDFFNQSVGAALAALLMLDAGPARAAGATAIGLGAILVVSGFVFAFT